MEVTMLEERTSRPSTQHSTGSGSEQAGEESRAAAITRVILIGAILSIVGIGAYAFVYTQTGIWQILADGAGLLLSLACLALAYWAVRRGRLDTAGYWLLLALLITYGASELVWANETWYNLIGGSLLFLLVGNLVLSRKWWAWLGMAGIYAAYVYLVNQWEPLPRYNAIEESGPIYLLDVGLTVLLSMLTLWLIYRIFRRGTIRTRLLVAFIGLVLLPVIAIAVAIVVTGRTTLQESVTAQLETAAESKEAEIEAWIQTLQIELATVLNTEDTRVHAPILLQEEDAAPSRYAAYQTLRDRFQVWTVDSPQFEELFIIDQQGRVVLSTDATHEGQIHSYQTYFWEGLKGSYITLLYYSRLLGRPAMVAAQPIISQEGEALGVLAGYADIGWINEIMHTQAWLSETGETYLVQSNHTALTNLRYSVPGQTGGTDMHTEGIDTVLETHTNGSGIYDNYRGESVIGVYHWLPDLELALLVEESQTEALGPLVVMLAGAGGIAAIAIGLAVVAALLITRSIASPLSDLAETALEVAAGDLECTVEVRGEDEIGTLAQTFNSMTTQIRELVGSLEQRVAKRTYELEQHSAYMQASAEVGRAASSILDADQLIQQVVGLIRERFGLYYVGLFLLDEAGEWAVLRAGTGEAGQAMLARGHRLRVGQGMIGWSIAHAQARIALQAEKDAVRRVTAELPDTRSEAALPLRSRGQIIGALTVQSAQFNAFDEDITAVLQIMADQVAVALDNARLYTESRASLEAMRRAYSELSRKGWIELLRSQSEIGYRSGRGGIAPAEEARQPEIEQALQKGERVVGNGTGDSEESSLAVPIKVRDDVIGVLSTRKPAEAGEWTTDEIALLEALTDQLGLALEGARLYQEAQRSAARERLTREITDQMRRATSVEGVVRTAVDELFSMLGTSRAFVRLGVNQPAQSSDRDRNDGHKQ
jgi:GAF domain-containing protein/HAMP domain-containing protein